MYYLRKLAELFSRHFLNLAPVSWLRLSPTFHYQTPFSTLYQHRFITSHKSKTLNFSLITKLSLLQYAHLLVNMAGHNHGHSCGHEHHQHSSGGSDLGALYSLYTKIDIDKVECLNEEREESGKCVFKPWDKRLETHEV